MRENNQAAGKTWTYAYDDGGNILSKTEYAYTTGSLGAAERTVAYGYGDASWSDLLTSIGGQSLTADEIGNLLSDGTWTYTWQHGRQLAGMSKAGTDIAYGYDSDGKRITKTVNGTAYNYHYLGDQLVELTWGGNKLHFTYDSTGPLSVNYNGTEYFYVKNAQGDVTGLVNASGTRVVTYTYDAWGNPLATTGSLAATLGAANPLRYRGYVYDTETGLYYLQSRYYNPGWGRFINADGYASTGQGIIGNNMFAYCGNNPVIRHDPTGQFGLTATIFGIAIWKIGVAVAGLAITYFAVRTIVRNIPTSSVFSWAKATPREKSNEKENAKAVPKQQWEGTTIYRYGKTNPGNLTPKQKDATTGLSFSTIPPPPGVPAAVTTLEALNATGVVVAIQDSPTHVSVRPVGASVQAWIDAEPSSVWTLAVKTVVIKWDGVR